ncbi:MAG: hypothetical protein V4676_05715, partial [Bacteroidota bacterium]
MFSGPGFPYGGSVGDMSSNWLSNFLGTVGTAALLLVVGVSYLIWQFNPSFNLPERKLFADDVYEANNKSTDDELPIILNEKFATTGQPATEKGNALKGEGNLIINENGTLKNGEPAFEIIERNDDDEEPAFTEPPIEKEIVGDL